MTSIQKNETNRIQVEVREFKERKFLDVREYFATNGDGKAEWHPTKRGITLAPDKAKELVAAITAAVK